MDKLFVSIESANLVKFLFDEVLHSLHIVVGDLLDVFHALGTNLVKVAIDGAKLGEQGMVEIGKLRQRQLTQGDEILYFHTHTVAYECILRKIVGQRLGLSSVTAIDGRYGCQQIKCHKRLFINSANGQMTYICCKFTNFF